MIGKICSSFSNHIRVFYVRNYAADAFLSLFFYASLLRLYTANYLIFGQIARLEKLRKKYS